MPTDSQLTFRFPLKGWHKGLDFRSQPADTSPDLLNCLPFDPATGRARGGQRPGTSKLYSMSIGSGEPIRYLASVTTSPLPGAVIPSEDVVVEDFIYSNDELADVDSGLTWQVRDTHPAGTIDKTSVDVVGQEVVYTLGSDVSKSCRLLRTVPGGLTLDMPATYVISMRVTLTQSFGTTYRPSISIEAGINQTTPGQNNIRLDFVWDQSTADWDISLRDPVIGSTVATATLPSTIVTPNVPFMLELQVSAASASGATLRGLLNGVAHVSGTTNQDCSQDGIGFRVGLQAGSTAGRTIKIDDYHAGEAIRATVSRSVKVVAVANGLVHEGDLSAINLVSGSGTFPLDPEARPQGAFLFNKLYLVDGVTTTIRKLDVPSMTLETYTADGTAPALPQLAAAWRGRLVVAALSGAENEFYMTRIGDPLDWQYGDTDAARAIAGNGSTVFGVIGQPIVALIPYTDDLLIFLCDHQIFQMTGDPAAGGTLDLISDQVGGQGPDCWTRDPTGAIYFVGTAGFYRMSPSGGVELLSGEGMNEYFRTISRTTDYVICAWDRDRHGCHIFVTNGMDGATSTHLWYDQRTGGMFPIQYPSTHGPLCACVFDGDGPDDRLLLMGGRTGYIQRLSDADTDDDGTAISSYVLMGPVQPFGDNIEAKVFALDSFLGNEAAGSYNLAWELRAAVDPEDIVADTQAAEASGTFTGSGRQAKQRVRLRGNSIGLRVSNSTIDKTWSFERFVVSVGQGAKVRV